MTNNNESNFKLLNAINQISDLLIKSLKIKELDEIMQEILKTLGNMSRADRCYIWENNYPTDSHLVFMKQIYEWVNEANKIEAVQDSPIIEFVPYNPDTYELLSSGKTMNEIVSQMDEYNRSILEPQNIKSILAVPIHLGDYFWGFIGCDNCHSEEIWSQVEEKTLMLIGFMIATVLDKHTVK